MRHVVLGLIVVLCSTVESVPSTAQVISPSASPQGSAQLVPPQVILPGRFITIDEVLKNSRSEVKRGMMVTAVQLTTYGAYLNQQQGGRQRFIVPATTMIWVVSLRYVRGFQTTAGFVPDYTVMIPYDAVTGKRYDRRAVGTLPGASPSPAPG